MCKKSEGDIESRSSLHPLSCSFVPQKRASLRHVLCSLNVFPGAVPYVWPKVVQTHSPCCLAQLTQPTKERRWIGNQHQHRTRGRRLAGARRTHTGWAVHRTTRRASTAESRRSPPGTRRTRASSAGSDHSSPRGAAATPTTRPPRHCSGLHITASPNEMNPKAINFSCSLVLRLPFAHLFYEQLRRLWHGWSHRSPLGAISEGTGTTRFDQWRELL